ncbi:hypothetical protein HWV62_11353 [Athelia sp. TMB]|nr:hypothetical protein HWV62_11353 [Athelia sp. TMB]
MKCRKCNQLDLVFEQGPIVSYPRPPANLFLSHVLPTDIEEEKRKSSIEAIKTRISQAEEHAAYLNTLVQELKKEQGRCAEECRSLADRLGEYESVNAPVKRVSNDALIEIFMAYTAANPYTREHLPAPMVLASVCRRWRDICTNTRSLWSHISIHVNRDSRFEAKANFVRIFTSRAGASPLQVAICDRLNYNGSHLVRYIEPEGVQLLVNEMAASAWILTTTLASRLLRELESSLQPVPANTSTPARRREARLRNRTSQGPRTPALSDPLHTPFREPTPLIASSSDSNPTSSPHSSPLSPIPEPLPILNLPSPTTTATLQSLPESPLSLTPPVTPTITIPPVIPPTIPLHTIPTADSDDEMTEIKAFRGTDKRIEKPQEWLRKLKGTKFKHDTSDAQRIFVFENHLEYGSKADTWFQNLSAAEKNTWANLEAAFHLKWEPLPQVEVSKDTLRAKYNTLVLKPEDIGKVVGEDGEETYTHVDWAYRVQALAEEIGDTDGNLLAAAKGNMPAAMILQLATTPTNTWATFTKAVCDLPITSLLLANQRDVDLAALLANVSIQPSHSYNRQPSSYVSPALATPRTPYRSSYTRTQSTPAQPAAPTLTVTNTAHTAPSTPLPQANAPSTPVRQAPPHMPSWGPPTPSPTDQRATLAQLAQQAVTKTKAYPPSAEGQRQYQEALALWERTFPGRRPGFNTGLYPLKPGTAALASGECFRCGCTGHMRNNCQSTSEISQAEASWRARVNGAINPPRARFEDADTLPVFQILRIDGEDIEVDTSVYDTRDMQFADEENQGNEQGSRY